MAHDPRHPPRPENKLALNRRDSQIVKMRAQGIPSQRIADELNIDVQLVYKALREAAEEVRDGMLELVQQRIMEHDTRYEYMYRQVQEKIEQADGLDLKEFANLIRAAVAILERQARLLGLDKAVITGVRAEKDWLESATPKELIDIAKRFDLVIPEKFEKMVS